MTDAESSTTSYTYDDANRRTQTTWPDHVASTNPGDPGYGITTVAYDAMGRVLRTTDQLGDTITHVYDLAGRRTNREYRTQANSPSGTIADQDTFTYDDAGRILTAVKGRYSNTVTFTYDEGGRRATEALTTGGQTYTVSLDYDDGGRTIEITYPDATTLDRTYTDRGQLEDVDYGTSDVAAFVYDDGGRETSRTFGNSLVTTTSYVTGENLIDTLTNSTVGNYSYTYDANDNKTAETITGVMSGYGFDTPSGYDDEDRLTNWERDDGNLDQSWNLSDVGDWNSFTENSTTENRTHNAVHELTAIDTNPLTYDAKGNLTSDDAGIDYTWDQDNMLASATIPTSPARGIEGTHTYAYDALGRRVSKTVDDVQQSTTETTVFVCLTQPIPYSPHAGQVLAEYTTGTASTSPLRKYTYGTYIDEPLAMIDRTAAGATAAGTDEPFYYHRNQQYSIVALSDSSGTVQERYHYTPYGETTILAPNGTTVRSASDIGNSFTYTGRRLDPETGLQYFRSRYVQGVIGRFINRDPLMYVDGPDVYVMHFLRNALDPTGMGSCTFTTLVPMKLSDYDAVPDGQCGTIAFKIDKFKLVRMTGTKGLCFGGETFSSIPLGISGTLSCSDTGSCPPGQTCCDVTDSRAESKTFSATIPVPAENNPLCFQVYEAKGGSQTYISSLGSCCPEEDCPILPPMGPPLKGPPGDSTDPFLGPPGDGPPSSDINPFK